MGSSSVPTNRLFLNGGSGKSPPFSAATAAVKNAGVGMVGCDVMAAFEAKTAPNDGCWLLLNDGTTMVGGVMADGGGEHDVMVVFRFFGGDITAAAVGVARCGGK